MIALLGKLILAYEKNCNIFYGLSPLFSQSTWYWQQPLPTGNFLYGVDFVNANTGYAVGTVGTIMKTTNGGVNWILQNPGSNLQLTFLKAINANVVIAVGEAGTILRDMISQQ